MAARKTWGQLSRATRDRWASRAAADYGLSRRSAREMYNRGTYKPGARTSDARVPAKIVRQRQRGTTEGSGRRTRQQAIDILMARRDALMKDRVIDTPGSRDKYYVQLDKLPDAVVIAMSGQNFDMSDAASYQAADMEAGKVPAKYRGLFYRNADGEWINAAWYH